ncbi:galactose-3-O-sulfotransferase 3-like [Branchiostoma floridae x Branchiostoma belcheri]
MGQHFVYFCFVVFLAALGFFASNLNTRPLNLDTTNSRTHYKNLLPPVRFKPLAPRQGALPPWLECEGGRERKRLAFPKNHKVGGTTFATILSRYAYTKKLNVVIPKPLSIPSNMYPDRLDPQHYMPHPPNQSFDMFLHHTVYNRTRFTQIMPKDTAYVTIIRKPFDHLKSAWNFYGYSHRFGLSKIKHPIATFLANPAKYDHNCGHGIHLPVCLTQNSISVDLGFSPQSNTKVTLGSDPVSREKVTQTFVSSIDEDFDFVMLTEYFDESLVLLKRLMCWTIRDIVYFKRTNVRNCPHEEVQLPPDLQQAHREWSFVDYALYDHFNKSFWRRINSSGNDYWGEVEYFKYLNKKIAEHCQSQCSFHKPPLFVNSTRWSSGFTVDGDLCLLIRRSFACNMATQAERVGESLKLPPKYSKGKTVTGRREGVRESGPDIWA